MFMTSWEAGVNLIKQCYSFISLENIIFTDIIDCLKEEVQTLKLNGVNKIIALGYAEYSRNIEIAEQVDGIDVIVGGHTNTFMYTGKQ